ncbi:hypothetical protein [Acetobacterium wieringae]|uniref:hypothetical protein n=1 Tax=Acetobacterium wieringae TaxID=52694 RepID=UPI002034043A|nr:hypothetical protein [Acetobacterium wieringae]URN83730.1 hypothetical protein CHL1_002885 [Acetobacterium wieringae]
MGNENHTVIVYFSKDGNTRSGAMRLNERLSGRIIELREQKKATSCRRFLKKAPNCKASPGRKS